MNNALTIALDAMGGDYAPNIVIEGAEIARKKYDHVRFLFVGHEKKIKPLLNKYPELLALSDVIHTEDFVKPDDKPSHALRNGRESSMRLAINAVAEGKANCVVSAGNTGALMATAKFVLKSLKGINRPAIASLLPSIRGKCVVLDLGANLECGSEHLVQFAILGNVFARAVLKIESPTIGLLNVGTEEMKGLDSIKEAATILKDQNFHGKFHGFVEGNDIAKGTVDVVVSDGFSGNVALKSMEGVASLMVHFFKQSLQESFLAKIGMLLSYFALKKFKKRMNPQEYNGGMLLGLNGICVKSHGGADKIGFANAIGFAYHMARNDYNSQVREELDYLSSIKEEMDVDGLSIKLASCVK